MGAESFTTKAKGKTVEAAFKAAVKQAQYDHGHAGYTGTIAEKAEFRLIDVPDAWAKLPEKFAAHLMDEDDKRIRDKWGPAGCVKIAPGEWLFFGWASS